MSVRHPSRRARRPRRPRRYAATLAAVAALGGLAGCGGGAEETSTPSTPSSSDSPSAPPSTPTLPTPYADVPSGVSLTEPGTEIEVGEQATVAWTPGKDTVGVVDLTVRRVEQTTIGKTFRGFRLSGAPDGAVPFLVTSSVTNVGDSDLGGRRLPLYARDDEGRLVEATVVPQDFKACPGGALPNDFGPDASARTCRVYLVPGDVELAGVSFVPPAPEETITWLADQPTGGATDQPSGEPTDEPSDQPSDGSTAEGEGS